MNFRIVFCLILNFVWMAAPFNFEEQDQRVGLTFIRLSQARISYDSYTILYHLDITRYKALTQLVEQYIEQADQATKMINDETVKMMIRHFKTQLHHMKRDESDIEAYQQNVRKRRAIEVVGSFLNWAFGLMDAEKARDYSNHLNILGQDNKRFHNLFREQTLLVKEVIEMNNKTKSHFDDQLRKLYTSIRSYFQNNKSYQKQLETELVFSESMIIADSIATEHRRISKQILHCLEEVVSGKITQLVPKEHLFNDLVEVQSLLKENQKLPINFHIENPLHIFKYSQVSASLFENRLLLEVTIPIIEREVYTVYKIVPIPTVIHNNTVIINPSINYILLNDQAEEYIPITLGEFSKGIFNLHGEKIIKPAENAHMDYNDNCEISIFRNPSKQAFSKFCDIKIIPTSNYFVSLNNNDMFYVQISKPLMITEYCFKKPSTFHEIKTSGLLQLDRRCRIVTDKVSLRPRANYRFDSKNIIVLANSTQNTTFQSITERINLLMNVSIPRIERNILISDYTTDFNNLVNKADDLIEKAKLDSKWKQMEYIHSQNSKKSFTFTGFMALIIIILIIFIVWFFYTRFFKLDTWVTLAKKLGDGNVHDIPRLFVHDIGSSRQELNGSMIQIEQPNPEMLIN